MIKTAELTSEWQLFGFGPPNFFPVQPFVVVVQKALQFLGQE
jgi:hypothetical protein